MPSPAIGFFATSHTEFRIHAYAAALQRGLTLNVWNTTRRGPMANKQFDLACALKRDTRCEWKMRVERHDVEGVERWTAVSLVEGHACGAEIEEADEAARRREWSRGKKRRRSPSSTVDLECGEDESSSRRLYSSSFTPTTPSSSLSRPSPELSIASTSHHPSTSHPQPPPSQHRLATSTPRILPPPSTSYSLNLIISASSQPISTTSTSSHPFPSSLTSFLRALSPALAPCAPNLLAGGINSIKSLTSLLRLEERHLKAFLADERVGLPKLFRVILAKKLVEGKREALGRRLDEECSSCEMNSTE